jgi:hypothetical protein
MTFAAKLHTALLDQLGKDWVIFMPSWDHQRRCPWQGPMSVPSAMVIHHTAAAATDSTNPTNPGNRKGANAGVIEYIQHKFEVPAANCTLDRDGRVYVHSAYPVWHAGLGSFTGKKPWSQLRIPDNQGNDYMAGVEVMSKGIKKDWTVHQQDSLVFLLRSWRDAADWDNVGLLRRPRHRDWTSRKIDPVYSNTEIGAMITRYGFATSATGVSA